MQLIVSHFSCSEIHLKGNENSETIEIEGLGEASETENKDSENAFFTPYEFAQLNAYLLYNYESENFIFDTSCEHSHTDDIFIPPPELG